MANFLENFLIELGLFAFLGVIYYFYQKKKILHFEENKHALVMGYILQSCLSEKTDETNMELDGVIESVDDFIQGRVAHPPYVLLKFYMNSSLCSPELKNIIHGGLIELGILNGEE